MAAIGHSAAQTPHPLQLASMMLGNPKGPASTALKIHETTHASQLTQMFLSTVALTAPAFTSLRAIGIPALEAVA